MGDITVQFGSPNITVQFPAAISYQATEAWLNALSVCDSDNISSGTGDSAEDAGVAIGEYYMTATNHIEAPGGVAKKRVI